MKKMILFAAMLLSMTAMAQTPVITFEKTTHDFGKINEADGRVTTIFEFKNEGMVPLVLSNVRASCGCTTPKWTREPIEPGANGQITVTYNPNGRPGRFQKTITVTSNATEATTKLYIKGEVIPKPANPSTTYTVKMGELSLKKKAWNFGIMQKKEGSKAGVIEYANTTNEVITVALETEPGATYLKAEATLQEIKPGETGKINFHLVPMECAIWGPIETQIYVIINGKRVHTNEFAITIKADIREDFSQMTVDELQQAPILEITSSNNNAINLGTFKAGKKIYTKLNFSNAGINPLIIRRIISNDETITVAQQPKATIKKGKKVDINMIISTIGLDAGNYTRIITVITNDPKKSVVKLTLNWVVE